ncbi:DUF2147 domain-containing protein [Winogradskyella litoriviva]|uniref:DUF2147 domain-containing protein n=1 Tax=Winogradskyella litoriviva TaxID=1220182 RepID=A0ABX2E6U8_9FLAO|nr:DUF2147 domain-containing protein [Winogradskyella litoriviva]NRD24069.1 DUF2147 domain-containing protein [Winogradskyella litoriviva]
MNKNILVLFSVFFMFSCLSAQSVLGKWKTIDDSTGKARSIIEIYESDGKIYGKIIELINPKSNNPLCKQCKGDKKNQPIIGLIIIDGLSKNDDVYEDGTILNPENGKTYDCRLKFEDDEDTLQVRGYLAFFYKTQYWKRIK